MLPLRELNVALSVNSPQLRRVSQQFRGTEQEEYINAQKLLREIAPVTVNSDVLLTQIIATEDWPALRAFLLVNPNYKSDNDDTLFMLVEQNNAIVAEELLRREVLAVSDDVMVETAAVNNDLTPLLLRYYRIPIEPLILQILMTRNRADLVLIYAPEYAFATPTPVAHGKIFTGREYEALLHAVSDRRQRLRVLEIAILQLSEYYYIVSTALRYT